MSPRSNVAPENLSWFQVTASDASRYFKSLENAPNQDEYPRLMNDILSRWIAWNQDMPLGVCLIDSFTGHFLGGICNHEQHFGFEVQPHPLLKRDRLANEGFSKYAAKLYEKLLEIHFFDRESFKAGLQRARFAAAAHLNGISLSESELKAAIKAAINSESTSAVRLFALEQEPSPGAFQSNCLEKFKPEDRFNSPKAKNEDPIVKLLLCEYEATRDSVVTYSGLTALPDRRVVSRIGNKLLSLLLPGYFGRRVGTRHYPEYVSRTVSWIRQNLGDQINRAKQHQFGDATGEDHRAWADEKAARLLSQIPIIRSILAEDIAAALKGDPAVFDHHEIVAAYPGIPAVALYRIAHELYQMAVPLIPRQITEFAHSKYGIDIHPGAKIGRGFFVDHGTGVVIGQTAELGSHVTCYQGVTIGAKNFPTDENGNLIRGQKRHPTIEDNVMVCANAAILGGDTLIGRNSDIGANVRIAKSIPPESVVTVQSNAPSVRNKSSKASKPKDVSFSPVY